MWMTDLGNRLFRGVSYYKVRLCALCKGPDL